MPIDSHKLKVPIVTPKNWGVFQMPTGGHEISAYYHPALNQIWINTDFPKLQRELSLLHENLHALTICCQPPQFYAIQAELSGISNTVPKSDHFKNIVESVCMVYLLVHTNLEVKEEFLVGGTEKEKKLAVRMVQIGHEVTKYAHPNSQRQTAIKEALNAICKLLMHVIPYNQCEEIILDFLSNTRPPQNWLNIISRSSIPN